MFQGNILDPVILQDLIQIEVEKFQHCRAFDYHLCIEEI